MNYEALLARMADQRAHWVDLPGGKRVQFHRPQEVEMPALIGGVRVQHVIDFACGWVGFTEADLLGAHAGSDAVVPWHRDLWAAWVRDHSDAVPVVAQALAEAISAHLEARGDIAKNSTPSST